LLVVWLAAGGGLGIAVLLVRAVSGPVSRYRVERFAARQDLVITAGNGNLVINYLRTTRRWRVIGLSTGVLVAAAWSLRDSRITVNALAAFAGWFVGALVAEYRVVSLEPGSRRAASLVPRLLRRQLRAPARTLLVGMVVVVAACALASLLAAAAGRDIEVPLLVGYALAAAGALGLPLLVGRHVLSRPRPLAAADDRQRADDALRDRSLHVLAGCAIALAAFPAANLALNLGRSLSETVVAPSTRILGAVLLVAGPISGWLVATRSRPQLVPAATRSAVAGRP
jgi:hypothetical protein